MGQRLIESLVFTCNYDYLISICIVRWNRLDAALLVFLCMNEGHLELASSISEVLSVGVVSTKQSCKAGYYQFLPLLTAFFLSQAALSRVQKVKV